MSLSFVVGGTSLLFILKGTSPLFIVGYVITMFSKGVPLGGTLLLFIVILRTPRPHPA